MLYCECKIGKTNFKFIKIKIKFIKLLIHHVLKVAVLVVKTTIYQECALSCKGNMFCGKCFVSILFLHHFEYKSVCSCCY